MAKKSDKARAVGLGLERQIEDLNGLLHKTLDELMVKESLFHAKNAWSMQPVRWRWVQEIEEKLREGKTNSASFDLVEAQGNRIASVTTLFGLLKDIHGEAVRILKGRAEQLGRDVFAIHQSAHYCRTFLADRMIDLNSSLGWPSCLGQTLIELPPDIRQAILKGDHEAMTLDGDWLATSGDVALDATKNDKMVTVMDVAQFLDIERTSLQCTGWPNPDEKGAGSRPNRWMMGTILPFLKKKYPKKKWVEFNP